MLVGTIDQAFAKAEVERKSAPAAASV
jgi:hypothetical protein